jgi:predicted PurR-regulated permease PerM
MKFLLFLLLLPIAILIAFVYASVWSAVFAAFLLSIGFSFIYKKPVKLLSTSIRVLVLSVVLYGAMFLGGLMGANEEIKTKIQLIEEELHSQNYHPKWVIISQKRSVFLNAKLDKSAQKSNHLIGLAIDLYVFDINGDRIYDN